MELVGPFEMTQPAISRHLKVLESAAVIVAASRAPSAPAGSHQPVSATPSGATLIGQETIEIDRVTRAGPAFHGCLHPAPIVHRPADRRSAFAPAQVKLPIGVQVVAAPCRESDALRVARALEQAGATDAKPA